MVSVDLDLDLDLEDSDSDAEMELEDSDEAGGENIPDPGDAESAESEQAAPHSPALQGSSDQEAAESDGIREAQRHAVRELLPRQPVSCFPFKSEC